MPRLSVFSWKLGHPPTDPGNESSPPDRSTRSEGLDTYHKGFIKRLLSYMGSKDDIAMDRPKTTMTW
jgi:hypothetical protein